MKTIKKWLRGRTRQETVTANLVLPFQVAFGEGQSKLVLHLFQEQITSGHTDVNEKWHICRVMKMPTCICTYLIFDNLLGFEIYLKKKQRSNFSS